MITLMVSSVDNDVMMFNMMCEMCLAHRLPHLCARTCATAHLTEKDDVMMANHNTAVVMMMSTTMMLKMMSTMSMMMYDLIVDEVRLQ